MAHSALVRFMVQAFPSPIKSSKVNVWGYPANTARRHDCPDTDKHICNPKSNCSVTPVIFSHGKACCFRVPSGKTMPDSCWIAASLY